MPKSAIFKKIGNRIAEARKKRGWNRNQLAKASSMSWANVVRYEDGENEPSAGKLLQVADALGVSADWLLGREGAEEVPSLGPVEISLRHAEILQGPGKVEPSDFRAVPLVTGSIAAGSARIVEEAVKEYALIHISQIRGRGDLVAIRVDRQVGGSMLPLIQPGAVVVLDRRDKNISPQGVYAVRDETGGCTLKRLQWTPPLLWLVPENRDEPITHIELRDEGVEDHIVGRVVWAYQPFL